MQGGCPEACSPPVRADGLAHLAYAGHLDDVEVDVADGVRYVALGSAEATVEVTVAVAVGPAAQNKSRRRISDLPVCLERVLRLVRLQRPQMRFFGFCLMTS